MNRAEANDILAMQKFGLGRFKAATINAALAATGDLANLLTLDPQEPVPARRQSGPSGQIRVWRSAVAGGNSSVNSPEARRAA